MSKHIKTARGIAALGRGEDKMLVHMTPNEVEGLQKLALATGGSLTINPKTGLVEAGWLSSILPLLAGGAATVLSGGTLGPVALALLGAGSGAVGAKIDGEDPMMGAVGGALGGFGGGSVANLAMGAGKAGASAAATSAYQQAAAEAAKGAAIEGAGATLGKEAMVASAGSLTPGSSVNALSGAAQNVLPAATAAGQGMSAAPDAVRLAAQQAGADAATNMGKKEAFMAGIKGLANKGGREAMVQSWQELTNPQKLGVAGAGMTAAQTASTAMGGGGGGGKKNRPMYYMTEAQYDPNGFVSFTPGTWTKDYPYNGKYSTKKAEGGVIDAPQPAQDQQNLQDYYTQMMQPPAPQPPVDQSANQAYLAKLNALVHKPPVAPEQPFQQTLPEAPAATGPALTKKQLELQRQRDVIAQMFGAIKGTKKKAAALSPADYKYNYDPSTGGFTKMAGGGDVEGKSGIAGLQHNSRFLRGPGDGVSDDIPAEINGGQPAALADGEFVVDAVSVSKLGNGSSEAGARALYAMMDRLHAVKTKPGKDINPEKYLPA